MRQVIESLVFSLLSFTVAVLIPFAWIMRDGMSPDSVTSTGLPAVERCFQTFYSGPVLIGLLALAVVVRWSGRRNRTVAAEIPRDQR